MAGLQLRDYQEECVRAHYSYFESHPGGNPLFVVPTGGGKSLIIAEFIRRTLDEWPHVRFLVLTHVKELIRQNHDEYVGYVSGADALIPSSAGIYSAGIGRREPGAQVLFAGVQSTYQRAEEIGPRDVVLVDEAHLVPKKGLGRYRTLLAALREQNPRVVVCGYTATHYRLDGGYLHSGKDALFTDVAYEVSLESLVRDGYLVPLVAKKPREEIDVSGVRVVGGEFVQRDLEVAATGIGCVEAAVKESVDIARADSRSSLLYFGTTVKHALTIEHHLQTLGVSVRSVFGGTSKSYRDHAVRDFCSGNLTALVNVGVLTTGFNAPRCDMMAIMRPTASAALYVQMMGRGMRTHPGKADCLVLDYGGNVERHGPVNAVKPKRDPSQEPGPPPMKTCPECSAIILLGQSPCPHCGHEWPESEMRVEHARVASLLAPFDPDADKPRAMIVKGWMIGRHEKKGRPPTMRVDYCHGTRVVSQWVCIEHAGYAGRMAARWWLDHGGGLPLPQTVDEAIGRRGELALPRAIEVAREGKYERVHRHLFHEVKT